MLYPRKGVTSTSESCRGREVLGAFTRCSHAVVPKRRPRTPSVDTIRTESGTHKWVRGSLLAQKRREESESVSDTQRVDSSTPVELQPAPRMPQNILPRPWTARLSVKPSHWFASCASAAWRARRHTVPRSDATAKEQRVRLPRWPGCTFCGALKLGLLLVVIAIGTNEPREHLTCFGSTSISSFSFSSSCPSSSCRGSPAVRASPPCTTRP